MSETKVVFADHDQVDLIWATIGPYYKQVGFDPLPKQKALLCSQRRWNIFVGGVGAGKSRTSAQFAWPRMLFSPPLPGAERVPRYWLVGENYEIAKVEFDYIADIFTDYGVPTTLNRPKEGRCELIVEGVCLIETKSWTNWDSLHGRPVQGMLICEAGLLDPAVWFERLRARLSRVTGSWVVMSGTLEDSGAFFKDLVRDVVVEGNRDDWFGISMASWENTYRFPGGMEDPEMEDLRRRTPPDIFMERYGAIPKTVAALVYREFSHSYHVGEYKFDKNQPVYLWTDPAGGYALNAVQKHGRDYYLVDEIHMEPGNTERVIEQTVRRPWWPNAQFNVLDATQVEARALWQGGRIWEALGENPIPVRCRKVPVEAGIELVRTLLHDGKYDAETTPKEDIWEFQGRKGVARLHVDARCQHTIREFSQGYKRKRLASGEYSDSEVVKRDDHHMDDIRYGLAEMEGFTAPSRPSARKKIRWRDSRPTVPANW